jgi:hypothetical protein
MLPLSAVVFIDLRVAGSLTTTYETAVSKVVTIARCCLELSAEVVIGRSICVPSSLNRVPFRDHGNKPKLANVLIAKPADNLWDRAP